MLYLERVGCIVPLAFYNSKKIVTHNNLRSRGHGITLFVIPSEYMRKSFVNRMLYSDIY